jgi:hypothetical protein
MRHSLCATIRRPLTVYEKVDGSNQPSLDYRADGSWRISPPELQAEFRAYLSRLGYRPAQLTQPRLKALVEAFMAERNCNKTAETEQILRDPR